MKILSNPWITGVLVAGAVGLVIYQVLGATGRRNQSPAAEPVTAAVAIIPAPTTANTSAPSESLAMDRKYLAQHLGGWIDNPQRDAFSAPVEKIHRASTDPLVSRWHLKAIWAQTGSRVAAINNGVYSEGDVIEELTVERIEDHQVWLKGPEGRELIEFESSRVKTSDKPNPQRTSSLVSKQSEHTTSE